MPRTKNKPAAKASDLNKFAGIKLEPLTLQRQQVALDMGMRWGFEFPYRRGYLLRDCVIALFLRTLPATGSGWTVDRCELDPSEAMAEANKWGQKMGIGINTDNFKAAHEIFFATMSEIQNAKGEPIIPENEEQEAPDKGEL